MSKNLPQSQCPKKQRVFQHKLIAAAVSVLLLCPPLAWAQESSEKILPRIDVVGSSDLEIEKIPGSVAVVKKEELEFLRPMSTEAALKNVPGIVIKPEEESAVVANIGLRGLSANENKLLVLEDGVPVAPGAFTGNGRYYNPRIQRMEGIEVLKGASSLRYGPNTIGGVINYKTKQPEDGVVVTGQMGSFGYKEYMLEAGGKTKDGNAIGGINAVTASSDGFMGKGYDMTDIMLKGGLALTDKQWLSAKVTHYKNDANISYRGVFLADYNNRVKYNPAPDDYLLIARDSLDVNHEWNIASDMKLNTLVYWSQMYRDYWRFGLNATPVLNGRWNYSNNVAGNNRDFERRGIDSRLKFNHESFGLQNETEIGVRIADETMHSEVVNATRANPRSGTIDQTKTVNQRAVNSAIFAENRFIISENFAISPGVRIEHYTLEKIISNTRGNSSNTEFMPGIGSTYRISPSAQMFGGVYKAFAPPQIADAISDAGLDQQLDAERSTNYEIGVRGTHKKLRYELAAFMMDFSNQIVKSITNTSSFANAGKTIHKGLEAGLGYELGAGFDVNANLTYVPVAKIESGQFVGKRVTYTPEMVSNLTIGYKQDKFKSSLVVSYVSAQFTDQGNNVSITELTNNDLWSGKLQGYTVADINLSYAVDKNLSYFGAIRNLTDTHYIASLRQGIYVGTSRNVMAGIRYKF